MSFSARTLFLLVLSLATANAASAQQFPGLATRLSCRHERFGVQSSIALLPGPGVSVGVIDSLSLASFAGYTLSEALTARLPGVSVMRSSGIAGTGSRVRLRGMNGIIGVQQPLLFVDGIRVEGEQQSIGLDVGGQAPSRLDDVRVEDDATSRPGPAFKGSIPRSRHRASRVPLSRICLCLPPHGRSHFASTRSGRSAMGR